MQQRFTSEDKDYDERVITKVYAHDIDWDIAKTIDYFWNEFK